jgi:flagellar hook-length control protein FliK
LQALLALMKASPDAALQKLSIEAAALLQTAKPEQILTQATMNGLERLLKQADLPAIPTKVSQPEPQANHNQLATQNPKTETSDSIAKPIQELDQMLQLLEAVRSMPEQESRKLLPELAALLAQTKEQALSALTETAALALSNAIVLEQTALLSDRVLSRQTEAAFEWLKNGAFQTELPLQFGTHSTQAKIRFFEETDKGAKGHSRRPLNINIYLDLPETGKLEAWARWEGSQIQATLYVRDAEARELFESQLLELSTNLREAGFSTAVLDVKIDPARLYRIQESAEHALPHEGSLLSLRV